MKRMQRRIVFGSKFLFIDLIYYGITSMPILVLSYYETTKNIGIFNVSMRTAAMLAVLLSISNTIISPKFSALARGGDFREIVRIYIFTSLIFFLFSLISLLFFQLFSTQYLSLFGPDLNGAEDILFLLIVSQLINMILGPAGPALAMCGFEKELIKCCFVSFTAVIISSAVLIPNYGMLGAGWVILIGMLVLKVTMLIYLSKRMDVLFHFRSLFFKTS
jgi:O-antigen/teichoic acid export membrane protein